MAVLLRVALLTLALCSPLRAQDGAHDRAPLALWGGLHVGMPMEEVRRRYPETKIVLNASCRGRFKPVFQSGKLKAVRILQYDDHNDCGRELYNALLRKYGPPKGHGSVGYFGLTGFGSSYDFYWYSERRSIRLRLLQSGRFSELSYAPDFDGEAQI